MNGCSRLDIAKKGAGLTKQNLFDTLSPYADEALAEFFANAAFEMYDKDGDGSIDMSALKGLSLH
jgi:Ca2+-binding EF-hand superfamily protein